MARASTKRKTNLFGFKKRVTFHGKIVRSGSTEHAPAKKGLSSIQQDVVDALVAMKMSRDQATRKVLAAKAGSFDDVFRSVMKKNPAGSWVVVSKATGKAVLETFSKKTVDKINRDKYEVLTAEQWLQRFNASVKKKNPAKFDRCVKKVSKSAKKRGKKVNAYAVCKTATKKNPMGVNEAFQIGRHARMTQHIESKPKALKEFGAWYAYRNRSGNIDTSISKATLKASFLRGWKDAAKFATNSKKNPAGGRFLLFGTTLFSEYKGDQLRSSVRVGHGVPVTILKRSGHRVFVKANNFGTPAWGWLDEKDAATLRAYRSAHGADPEGKGRATNPKAVWTSKQGTASARVLRSGVPGLRKYKVQILRGSGVIQERDANNLGGAISIARLLLHQRATNPTADLIPGASTLMQTADKTGGAWGKVAKRFKKALKGKRSKNPVDKAVKMYEEFHGLPASEMIDVESKEHIHSVKVGVGYLVCLDVITVDGKTEVPLTAEGFSFHPANHLPRKLREKKDYWQFDTKTPLNKVVLCTMNEAGNQLFLDGGNQEIPFAPFGLNQKDERDHMLVGTIVEITYRTKKRFEANGKVPVDFHHQFGKEGSGDICPVLLYFPRSKQLKIAGGRYQIAAPEKSLGYVSPGIIG